MLIATTTSPRRDGGPISMPDGTKYQFEVNEAGVFLCEVANAEHAEMLLKHDIYSAVEMSVPPAKAKRTTKKTVTEPAVSEAPTAESSDPDEAPFE